MDRSRLTRALEATVAAGAIGACLATAHTAYNLGRLRTPSRRPPATAERVSILVPARDEASRIGACISALLASEGLTDLEVIVLDDGSSDGTADVARRAALETGRTEATVQVLDGGTAPLPEGWLGKTWACARLARAATGSVLVFVDADVTVAPLGIAASVALMRDAGLDLVSPYPRQEAEGLVPRLVQPLLQWSWATLLPLDLAERSPRPSLVAANGQLLVVDTGVYREAGGHDAVRGEVLDDVALLRAVKAIGGCGVVVDGTDVATCRMYDDTSSLVEGYSKSLWSAFGSPVGAAGVMAMLSWLYVLPPVAAIAGPTAKARTWGAVGYAAGVTGRALVARRTGGRLLPDITAHPASIAALGVLVAESWRRRRSGSLTWRGRTLP